MVEYKALVLLADGSEEMETVIPVDILRRAKVCTVIAGLESDSPVQCCWSTKLVPDFSLDVATKQGPYDVVVIPGGLMGAEKFSKSEAVGKLLSDQYHSKGRIAAICAGPTVLFAHGIGKGSRVTLHPSLHGQVPDGYKLSTERVVVDQQLITSQGPGTAIEFALSIVQELCGDEVVAELKKKMLIMG